MRNEIEVLGEPLESALGIEALGREDWDDGEAELDGSCENRVRPNYDVPIDDDCEEVDQDADDEAD